MSSVSQSGGRGLGCGREESAWVRNFRSQTPPSKNPTQCHSWADTTCESPYGTQAGRLCSPLHPLFLTFAPPHLLAPALALPLILICFLPCNPTPVPTTTTTSSSSSSRGHLFFLPNPGLHLFLLLSKGSSPNHDTFTPFPLNPLPTTSSHSLFDTLKYPGTVLHIQDGIGV